MNSRLFLFGALCFLFTFSSCKKNAISTGSAAPTLINKMNVLNLDFKYFNARGKMQLEEEGDKITSGINVRMRKDSIIWISVVPALGIEAARIRVTQDSVHVINRIKKEYFAGDYTIIKQKFKVDVTYNLLQTIMLGNYLPAPDDSKEKIVAQTPLQHSRQQQANLVIDQFLDVSTFKLKKISIKDPDTRNSISVDYSKFEPVGDVPFARAALIVVQQGQVPGEKDKVKGAIGSIDYNKINLNETSVSFPFSVPQGYKRQ
jgi:hypothetical protein